MPGFLFDQDPDLKEHFTFDDQVGTEFGKFPGVVWKRAACRHCTTTWALSLDANGCLDKGERGALLSHAREHARSGLRMRRLSK